jgi:hypothetical protein
VRLRFTLVVLFGFLCTGASAQWYRLGAKKPQPRTIPEELNITDHSIARIPAARIDHPKITPVRFAPSDFSIDAQEAVVMKTAQHNMRFRVYTDARYNFSDLAHLYIIQKRYSEAKWYLLQSVNISKEQNDDKHTLSNLIDLATIKVIIGEYQLAQQDLDEARDLATVRGFTDYIDTIDLTALYLKQTREPVQKPTMVYADGVSNNTKGQ